MGVGIGRGCGVGGLGWIGVRVGYLVILGTFIIVISRNRVILLRSYDMIA